MLPTICLYPRPRIYRLHTPNFFALLFMLYSTAAYDSYKFEWEIQIQSNDLNSLAASIQETLLSERFQRCTRSIYLDVYGLYPQSRSENFKIHSIR